MIWTSYHSNQRVVVRRSGLAVKTLLEATSALGLLDGATRSSCIPQSSFPTKLKVALSPMVDTGVANKLAKLVISKVY